MRKKVMAFMLSILTVLSLLSLPAYAVDLPGVSTNQFMSTYTLKSSGKVYAYKDEALKEKTGGYIACSSDECRIVQISSNGKSVKVSYPTSSGRKTAWFSRNEFTSWDISSGADVSFFASKKITTYRRSTGNTEYGYVSKGDKCYLLSELDGRSQIVYPTGKTWKIAWIAADNSYETISDGMYTLETMLKSGMVLDAHNFQTNNGTNIEIYADNGGNNQKFNITSVGNGWYTITSVYCGKAVDVSNGASKKGCNVQLWDLNKGAAQLWRFYNAGNGSYYLKNKGGFYLDVQNKETANGTNVVVWSSLDGTNQQWKLNKTSKDNYVSVTDGMYTISSAVKNNFVLDVYGYGNENGTNVAVYTGHGGDNQKFNIKSVGGGWYKILSLNGKAVDVANGGGYSGCNVQIWDDNPADVQQWKFYDAGNGYYYIKSKTGYYLDVYGGGTDEGTNVAVYTGHGGTNQKWHLSASKPTIYPTSVSINTGDFTLNGYGKTKSLKATVLPDNTTNKNVTWSSSNKNIAKVNSNGKVTALSNGTAIITVKCDANNIKASVKVTVKGCNEIVSADEIAAAASKYGIKAGSNAYKALESINTKYYDSLKNDKSKTLVFFFEGVGNNSSASKRLNAMSVVVNNGKIKYINKNSSTIPDYPFNPSKNGGTAMPTIKSGVYDFTTVNHKKTYAALNVTDAKVLRHKSKTSYYNSTSSAINVHKRSSNSIAPSNASWVNSAGCLLVGKKPDSSNTSEYAQFIQAVGIVNSNGTASSKYQTSVNGKIIVDREYAESYLKSIGYQSGAIEKLGK